MDSSGHDPVADRIKPRKICPEVPLSNPKDPTRREFLTGSAAALAAAATAMGAQQKPDAVDSADRPADPSAPYAPEEPQRASPQRTFSGESATQVAMPLGGIGAGSICLNGMAAYRFFDPHAPESSALPEGFSSNSPKQPSRAAHQGRSRDRRKPAIPSSLKARFRPSKSLIRDCRVRGCAGRIRGVSALSQNAPFAASTHLEGRSSMTPPVPLEVTLLGWNPFIRWTLKTPHPLRHPGIHAAQYFCDAGGV